MKTGNCLFRIAWVCLKLIVCYIQFRLPEEQLYTVSFNYVLFVRMHPHVLMQLLTPFHFYLTQRLGLIHWFSCNLQTNNYTLAYQYQVTRWNNVLCVQHMTELQISHALVAWKCQHKEALALHFPSYCVALLQYDAFIKHQGSQRLSCVPICKCDCVTTTGSQKVGGSKQSLLIGEESLQTMTWLSKNHMKICEQFQSISWFDIVRCWWETVDYCLLLSIVHCYINNINYVLFSPLLLWTWVKQCFHNRFLFLKLNHLMLF